MTRHACNACLVLALAWIAITPWPRAWADDPTDTRPTPDTAHPPAAADPPPRAGTADATDDAAAPAFAIGDVVVTVSRSPRDPDTVAADVTVINRAAIEASGATSVPELLRTQAGITITTLGNPTSADIGIRGFGQGQVGNLNTAVLIDGLRANFADLAPVDYMSIPLDQVDRIEIRRGGGGAQYGNNATAGVINIVTRRATANRVSLGAEVDSYGYSSSLALGWSEADWSAFLQQRYDDSDGYRDNNVFRNHTAFLSLSYLPADGPWQFELAAGVQDEDYGLPGGLNAGERAVLGRRGSADLRNDVTRESGFVNVTPRWIINDENELSLGLGYRERLTEADIFFGMFAAPSADRQFLYSAAPQWTNRTPLFGRPNTVTIGVDASVADLHAIANRTDSTQTLLALFAHDSLQIVDAVYLDLGVRIADADMAFGDGFQDVGESLYAWNLGLTWNYAADSKVFVGYDRSYRLPVLDEYQVYDFALMALVVNTDLQPQITHTWQAGVRHHLHRAFIPSLTVFYIETADEIFFDPVSFTNTNYRRTRRTGATLALESRPVDWLDLAMNYTWLDARFGSDPVVDADGERIPMAPEQTLNARATIRLPAGFTLTVNAAWLDAQRLINDQANSRPPLPDRWLVDTRLSYTWGPLTLYAGVDNLFDERYDEAGIASGAGPAFDDYYPAPERSYTGGIQLQFNY